MRSEVVAPYDNYLYTWTGGWILRHLYTKIYVYSLCVWKDKCYNLKQFQIRLNPGVRHGFQYQGNSRYIQLLRRKDGSTNGNG